MQVTRNLDTGKIDGVVAISRDVTQQKNAEAKLPALAILDGLTGLANRRRFDERLQEEWARACREGTSLSLLMVDVDHFKKFNDQYGHLAGDACLQAVAQVLAAEARPTRRSGHQVWWRRVRNAVAEHRCGRLQTRRREDPAASSAALHTSCTEHSLQEGDGKSGWSNHPTARGQSHRKLIVGPKGRPSALCRQGKRTRLINHGRPSDRAT